ncbi:hypothetical protein ACFLXE_07480 [Chloroflexota bacterium]
MHPGLPDPESLSAGELQEWQQRFDAALQEAEESQWRLLEIDEPENTECVEGLDVSETQAEKRSDSLE